MLVADLVRSHGWTPRVRGAQDWVFWWLGLWRETSYGRQWQDHNLRHAAPRDVAVSVDARAGAAGGTTPGCASARQVQWRNLMVLACTSFGCGHGPSCPHRWHNLDCFAYQCVQCVEMLNHAVEAWWTHNLLKY